MLIQFRLQSSVYLARTRITVTTGLVLITTLSAVLPSVVLLHGSREILLHTNNYQMNLRKFFTVGDSLDKPFISNIFFLKQNSTNQPINPEASGSSDEVQNHQWVTYSHIRVSGRNIYQGSADITCPE